MLQKTAYILLAALIAAIVHSGLRPLQLELKANGETGPKAEGKGQGPRLSLERGLELYRRGDVMFFDARARNEYERGHISGAFHMPPDAFSGGAVPEMLESMSREYTPIVVYCESEDDCDASLLVARMLQELGFSQVHVLSAGFRGWSARGLPVQP